MAKHESFQERGPLKPINVSLSADNYSIGGSSDDGYWDVVADGEEGIRRFNDKVSRKVREQLPDIIKSKDFPIDGNGGETFDVYVKPEDRPHFHKGDNSQKGYGSGNGEEGDIVAQGPGDGKGGQQGAHGVEGQGDLHKITLSADEIMKMVFQDWELPDLDSNRVGQMVEEDIQWNDVRKRRSGPDALLDKKRTAYENLKRQAAKGEHKLGQFIPDDNRFKTYTPVEKPSTNAVIIAMRDVSGSIGPDEEYAAKVLLSWTLRFLKTQYTTVKIVFGYHHSSAKIDLTEEQFFNPGESGGTDLIPALEKMNEKVDKDFPPSDWNVYPFYVGDGYIWENKSNQKLREQFTSLVDKSRIFFYAQTNIRDMEGTDFEDVEYQTSLMELIKDVNDPRVLSANINNKKGIANALDKFFKKKEGREGAVRSA